MKKMNEEKLETKILVRDKHRNNINCISNNNNNVITISWNFY